MTRCQQMPSQSFELIGLFGVTFENGFIETKFKIARCVDNEYVVQLYSFLTGEPGTVKFMTLNEIKDGRLFLTEDEWFDALRADNERHARHVPELRNRSSSNSNLADRKAS